MTKEIIAASQMPGFNALTPREQAFVLHPDVLREPKKAALEVGYSSSVAGTRAYSMRVRLMRYIAPRMEARLTKAEISRERVEQELAAIGFLDVTEFRERIDVEMKDGGFQSVLVWKDIHDLTPEQRRAIKTVDYEYVRTADDEMIQSDRPSIITFHSKDKALHELAGLFGDMGPKNPGDEQQQLFDNLSTDEREELVRLYQIAARRAAGKLKPEGTNVEPSPVPRVETASPRRSEVARDSDRSSEGAGREPDDAGQQITGSRVRKKRAPVTIPADPAPARVGRGSRVTTVSDTDSDAGYSELPG